MQSETKNNPALAFASTTGFVPPDLARRGLLFDSFSRLKARGTPPLATDQGHGPKNSRGTVLSSWGAGYHGQLGYANNNMRKKCVLEPSMIDFSDPVVQVACGGFHTACLTESGQVWSWGDGRQGQLGNLARKHNMLATPSLVEQLTQHKVTVSMIACGQQHTACVTTNGGLYTWGSGRAGQLGHGTRLEQRWPTLVNIERGWGRFDSVGCGDRHTAAIMKDTHGRTRLVTCGNAQHGQLGHGEGDDQLTFKTVEAFTGQGPKLTTLTCGATTTAAITNEGELFLWGFGESIHPKGHANIVDFPRKVRFPTQRGQQPAICEAALGQSHVLALTRTGDVYAWGCGQMGQLGHGATSNVRNPRLVLKGKNIKAVSAGRYHSLAVTASGILFSWGCGESGQLGHGSLEGHMLPTVVAAMLPAVVGRISCGEHHCFCLSSVQHASLPIDLQRWKKIEDEELRIKHLMLRELPSGFQTKHILDLHRNRKQLVHDLESQWAREEQVQKAACEADIASIESRPSILASLNETDTKRITQQMTPLRGRRKLLANSSSERQLPTTSLDGLRPSMSTPALHLKPNRRSPGSPLLRMPSVAQTGRKGRTLSGRARAGKSERRPSTAGVILSCSSPSLGMTALTGLKTELKSPVEGEMTADERAAMLVQKATLAQRNQGGFQLLAPRLAFLEHTHETLKRVKQGIHVASQRNQKAIVDLVFKTKREYNRLFEEHKRKKSQYASLRREYTYQQYTRDEEKKLQSSTSHIKDLRMKLVTLNTRLIEAEENKRNYELYIIRMKEEDVVLSKQIDELRQLVMEYRRLLKKTASRNDSLLNAKGEINGEIIAFEKEIDGFAHFAGYQLSKYRHLISNRLRNTKQARKELKSQQTRKNKKQRRKLNHLQAEERNLESETREVKKELIGWGDKVQYYEKRFHKISAATGLNNPDDIVNKFFYNDEITKSLSETAQQKELHHNKLQEKQKELTLRLEHAKELFQTSKWRHIERMESANWMGGQHLEHSREEAFHLQKKLVFAQQGIERLLTSLDTNGALNGYAKQQSEMELKEEEGLIGLNPLSFAGRASSTDLVPTPLATTALASMDQTFQQTRLETLVPELQDKLIFLAQRVQLQQVIVEERQKKAADKLREQEQERITKNAARLLATKNRTFSPAAGVNVSHLLAQARVQVGIEAGLEQMITLPEDREKSEESFVKTENRSDGCDMSEDDTALQNKDRHVSITESEVTIVAENAESLPSRSNKEASQETKKEAAQGNALDESAESTVVLRANVVVATEPEQGVDENTVRTESKSRPNGDEISS